MKCKVTFSSTKLFIYSVKEIVNTLFLSKNFKWNFIYEINCWWNYSVLNHYTLSSVEIQNIIALETIAVYRNISFKKSKLEEKKNIKWFRIKSYTFRNWADTSFLNSQSGLFHSRDRNLNLSQKLSFENLSKSPANF